MKQNTRNLRKHLLCSATLYGAFGLFIGSATGVVAEGNNANEYSPLGRIVLGAGVAKIAIDTPQAVTVVDQEDIDRAQATTPAELFDTIPGIQAIGSERAVGMSFNIRGIGELAASDESKIIVTVDGAIKNYEQYRMGSFFSDPELYKAVEVLRGPASSTLYGSGALGGVINFTTKDATDFLTEGRNTAVRAKLSYDSNGKGKLASVIFAQRFSDSFEMLGSINYREADNYVDGDGTEIAGSAFVSKSMLLKGTYYLGNDNEQALRFSYSRWNSNLEDTEYSQTGSTPFGTVDRDTTDETFSLSYENPGLNNPYLDLAVTLAYSNTNVVQKDALYGPGSLFSDSEYAYKTLSFKVENTIEMGGDNWENYLTIGAQISNQDREATTATGPLGFHPGGNDKKIGIYVQSEFTIGEKLTIIPGARLDFITQTPDSSVTGGSKQTETAFSPKIAAMYKFNDTFSIFGSIARTERAATLDEIYSTSAASPTARSYPGGRTLSTGLAKETSNTVELGFAIQRTGIFNDEDSVSMKATAFYNDLSNLISSNPDNTNAASVIYYVNIDKAEIWGVELEGSYQSERMFATLAYSNVHGRDKSTGVTLSSIPASNLALTLGGRNRDLGLEYGWTGNFVQGITTSAGTFNNYATHSVFASWKPQQGVMRGASVRLSVDNLLGTTYKNNLSGDNGRGRTVKLTLTKSF